MARTARTAGQLAAAFPRDPWTLSGGLPIAPEEDGDQMDIFEVLALAEVPAEVTR